VSLLVFISDSYTRCSRSIMDACCAFTITCGCAIMFAFSVEKYINQWVKIRLLYSPELERKVAEVDSFSSKIGTNFEILRL